MNVSQFPLSRTASVARAVSASRDRSHFELTRLPQPPVVQRSTATIASMERPVRQAAKKASQSYRNEGGDDSDDDDGDYDDGSHSVSSADDLVSAIVLDTTGKSVS